MLGLDPAPFTSSRTAPAGRPPSSRRPSRRSAGASGSGSTIARVVLCVGGQAAAQEPGAPVAALPLLPDDVVVVLAGHAEPYEDELRRGRASLGAGRARALPGYLAERRARGALAARALRRVPDPRGGLRAAGARGDGARRAGGVLGHSRAARGRRRACRTTSLRTTSGAAAADPGRVAIAEGGGAGRARARALLLGGRRAGDARGVRARAGARPDARRTEPRLPRARARPAAWRSPRGS